jgi:hypothetical protein
MGMFFVSAVLGLFLIIPSVSQADSKGIHKGHREVTGVVKSEQGGIYTVETPTGNYSLNENAARRHGHAIPKVGDEVTIVLDENNLVIEAHPKGEMGRHHFYTGKLVHLGKMQKEVKILTPDGEKVFPIDRLEIKTKGIEEGTMVTVEVNEGGTAIDLHRATDGGDAHDKH